MSKEKLFQAFLVMLLILTVGIGSGFLLQFYLSPTGEISLLLMRVTMLVAISITVGLAARFAIPTAMLAIKILYTLIGCVVSILTLDRFYQSPYSLLDSTGTITDWQIAEFTQIFVLMGLTMFIALARKKARPGSPQVRTKEPFSIKKSWEGFSSSVTATLSRWKNNLLSIDIRSISNKKAKRKSSPNKKQNSSSTSRAKTTKTTHANPQNKVRIKKNSSTPAVKTKIRKKKANKNNADVKLVGREEHRCPYCLEEVKKNDPRGVKICPDCGTWHHQDCWNVTGSCQIAHKHEL